MSLSAAEQKMRRNRRNTQTSSTNDSISNNPPDQFNPALVPQSTAEPIEGFHLIPLEKLITFQEKGNGDFTPLNEKELQQMADTMDEHGPNEPIIVRQLANLKYEILSGEQRYRASKLKGVQKIRAIIQRNCSDKKAKEIFLIQNLSRRKDRISDKIYGWKQFWDLNGGHITESLKEINVKDSYATVNIYVKCANLSADMIAYMDAGKLSLRAGYQLAFLTSEEQRLLIPYVNKITESIAKEIRTSSENEQLSELWLINYFSDNAINPESSSESTASPDPEDDSTAAVSPSFEKLILNRERALKKKTVNEKRIRSGMRKIRTDIIDRISPQYYDQLADIIAQALDLFLSENVEYEITDEERNQLRQLQEEAELSADGSTVSND